MYCTLIFILFPIEYLRFRTLFQRLNDAIGNRFEQRQNMHGITEV